MGAVGPKQSILFTKEIRRKRGQRYTSIFITTFYRTLATYSYLVIGLCPHFKFTSKHVIIIVWQLNDRVTPKD